MASKKKDLIEIVNFNEGGLAASKYSGIKNSFYRLIGHDPHTQPGVLDVEQKLTKISEELVDELCKVGVNASNGSAFMFSSESGKIWEIQSSGTVRLVHTTTPSAGEAKCLGAVEYDGKIIWATEDKLHYITTVKSSLNNWGADAVEDWQTFDVGDPDFHPMRNHTATLTLYIGDGNQLAQYEASTGIFSSNALDIREPLRIKSLGGIATDVLIGTYIADTVTGVEILRWNTWEDSFSNSDPIPEISVNAFLPSDNAVLAQCGNKGNIYYYDGEVMELYLRIPGTYSPQALAEVNPYSVALKDGQMLFGLSNITGNPAPQLIYRIARHSRDYKWIMDQPYPISQRSSGEFVMSDVEIGAVLVQGDLVLTSWKNGSDAGFDRTDITAKLDGAYWETRAMIVTREALTNMSEAFIAYASFPDNTALDFYLSKNYGAYGNALEKESNNDTDRNIVKTKGEATGFTTLQLKVKTTVSGNNAPLVESGAVRIR